MLTTVLCALTALCAIATTSQAQEVFTIEDFAFEARFDLCQLMGKAYNPWTGQCEELQVGPVGQCGPDTLAPETCREMGKRYRGWPDCTCGSSATPKGWNGVPHVHRPGDVRFSPSVPGGLVAVMVDIDYHVRVPTQEVDEVIDLVMAGVDVSWDYEVGYNSELE